MTTQTSQPLGGSGGGTAGLTSTGSGDDPSVRERAASVGGTARDEATGVAQEAKQQARDLMGEARTQVRQQVDAQKGRLADVLREIGDELDQMADSSGRDGLASELVRQAAQRARDARGYLEGGGDVVDDVRSLARRRPGAFLLGAVVAGVLAGRATRAATAARSAQQGPDRSTGYPTSAYPTTSTYASPQYPSTLDPTPYAAEQYPTQYPAEAYPATQYASPQYASPGQGATTGYGTGTAPGATSASEYQATEYVEVTEPDDPLRERRP